MRFWFGVDKDEVPIIEVQTLENGVIHVSIGTAQRPAPGKTTGDPNEWVLSVMGPPTEIIFPGNTAREVMVEETR